MSAGAISVTEGRYIPADEAQKYVDDGWDVEPLWAHWPYCLAHREHKGVNPAPFLPEGGEA